jgi:hypothetical protein
MGNSLIGLFIFEEPAVSGEKFLPIMEEGGADVCHNPE